MLEGIGQALLGRVGRRGEGRVGWGRDPDVVDGHRHQELVSCHLKRNTMRYNEFVLRQNLQKPELNGVPKQLGKIVCVFI